MGEIRDLETAEIAVQASLTGHMVFSTLHTNDAPSTVTRLRDMGVPPFLITATLEAVLAQRLVRKICRECREQTMPGTEMLAATEADARRRDRQEILPRPRLRRLQQHGLQGPHRPVRVHAHQRRLRDLINKGASTDKLRDAAMADGMMPLRESGLGKGLRRHDHHRGSDSRNGTRT